MPFDISSFKFFTACCEDVAAQTDFVKILVPLSNLKHSDINKVWYDKMFSYNEVSVGMFILDQQTANCTGLW